MTWNFKARLSRRGAILIQTPAQFSFLEQKFLYPILFTSPFQRTLSRQCGKLSAKRLFIALAAWRGRQSRFHLRPNSPSCKTSLPNESKIKSLPLEPLIKTDGFPCVTVAVRMRRSRRSSEVQPLNTEYMLLQLHNKRRLMSVGPNFSSTLRAQIQRLLCPSWFKVPFSQLCLPLPTYLVTHTRLSSLYQLLMTPVAPSLHQHASLYAPPTPVS